MWTTNRARRYPLEIGLQFRLLGSDGWRTGHTMNISQSGVLFRTSHSLPADGDGELEITLILSALGPRMADVYCTGRVVRAAVLDGTDSAIAVTIEGYRFNRLAFDRLS